LPRLKEYQRSAFIASSMVSSARSAASAPIFMASSARWKSNQAMFPRRGLIYPADRPPAAPSLCGLA
jgi:hypothetical protein